LHLHGTFHCFDFRLFLNQFEVIGIFMLEFQYTVTFIIIVCCLFSRKGTTHYLVFLCMCYMQLTKSLNEFDVEEQTTSQLESRCPNVKVCLGSVASFDSLTKVTFNLATKTCLTCIRCSLLCRTCQLLKEIHFVVVYCSL